MHEIRAHEWNNVEQALRFLYLQFVGILWCLEFQVEIVHLLQFFLIEELFSTQKMVKLNKMLRLCRLTFRMLKKVVTISSVF